MKKFMMIAAMMVAAVSANAQFEAGTFSLQPKAGFGMSWLSNMPKLSANYGNVSSVTIDKSSIVAAVLGVEAEYQFMPQISLAAGVNYSLQGGGWDDLTVDLGSYKATREDAKYELGYVTVPVTFNYYIFKGFAVKAGVQFGFLTNAKDKYTETETISGNEKKVDYSEDIKDSCKKFDLSIPVGVSYQFNVPIVLDLRYNIGMSKVNKYDMTDGNMKNNVIQLTVGYKFAL